MASAIHAVFEAQDGNQRLDGQQLHDAAALV
jgi:hypothetical protein